MIKLSAACTSETSSDSSSQQSMQVSLSSVLSCCKYGMASAGALPFISGGEGSPIDFVPLCAVTSPGILASVQGSSNVVKLDDIFNECFGSGSKLLIDVLVRVIKMSNGTSTDVEYTSGVVLDKHKYVNALGCALAGENILSVRSLLRDGNCDKENACQHIVSSKDKQDVFFKSTWLSDAGTCPGPGCPGAFSFNVHKLWEQLEYNHAW